jgi:hypothetical protein
MNRTTWKILKYILIAILCLVGAQQLVNHLGFVFNALTALAMFFGIIYVDRKSKAQPVLKLDAEIESDEIVEQ